MKDFDKVLSQIWKSNRIKLTRRAERVPATKGGYRKPRWGGLLTK